MELIQGALLLVAVSAAFTTSAAVGLGGSLVLVPTLTLVMGTKEGVALAALLLGANNFFKVLAYRRSLPVKSALGLLALLSLGALIGAIALVYAPEDLVTAAVVAGIVVALLAERRALTGILRVGAPALAFGAGATSGFSGTSGPLKGASLRTLGLDRRHLAGGASLLSLAGDATKAGVFAEAALLDTSSLLLCVAAVPVMILSTLTGRHLNGRVGERGYAAMFWVVMGGYVARLVLA